MRGYQIQVFAYAGVLRDPGTGKIWLLPLTDRLLADRHWLPLHPGNSYPAPFAPVRILQAIAWPPYTR
jgi:hypothetical protein